MILPFPDRPAEDIESIRADLQKWNELICKALIQGDGDFVRQFRASRSHAEESLSRAMERKRLVGRAGGQ